MSQALARQTATRGRPWWHGGEFGRFSAPMKPDFNDDVAQQCRLGSVSSRVRPLSPGVCLQCLHAIMDTSEFRFWSVSSQLLCPSGHRDDGGFSSFPSVIPETRSGQNSAIRLTPTTESQSRLGCSHTTERVSSAYYFQLLWEQAAAPGCSSLDIHTRSTTRNTFAIICKRPVYLIIRRCYRHG